MQAIYKNFAFCVLDLNRAIHEGYRDSCTNQTSQRILRNVAAFKKEEDEHHLKLEKSHCIVVLKGVEVVEALGNCPSTKDTTQPLLLLDWSSPLMILAAEGRWS